MRCSGNECRVYKSGLCLDLKEYAPLAYNPGPFAYWGQYDNYGGSWMQAGVARVSSETAEDARKAWAQGAQQFLKDVQGTGTTLLTMDQKYECSNTVMWYNSGKGSDAEQAKSAIAIF